MPDAAHKPKFVQVTNPTLIWTGTTSDSTIRNDDYKKNNGVME